MAEEEWWTFHFCSSLLKSGRWELAECFCLQLVSYPWPKEFSFSLRNSCLVWLCFHGSHLLPHSCLPVFCSFSKSLVFEKFTSRLFSFDIEELIQGFCLQLVPFSSPQASSLSISISVFSGFLSLIFILFQALTFLPFTSSHSPSASHLLFSLANAI